MLQDPFAPVLEGSRRFSCRLMLLGAQNDVKYLNNKLLIAKLFGKKNEKGKSCEKKRKRKQTILG